jgi:hypothetical protein
VYAGPFCFMREQDPAATKLAAVDPSLLVRTLCVLVPWAWLLRLASVPTRSTPSELGIGPTGTMRFLCGWGYITLTQDTATGAGGDASGNVHAAAAAYDGLRAGVVLQALLR